MDSPIFPRPRGTLPPTPDHKSAEYLELDKDETPNEALLHKPESVFVTTPKVGETGLNLTDSISNGSGLPGFGAGWNWNRDPGPG
jgi:hypothetical protein